MIKQSIIELSKEKCEKRKIAYKKGKCLQKIHVVLRRIIHPVLYGLMKIDKKLSKEKIVIINDQHKVHDNVIYASTHIGGNDVQRVFEAIRHHAYLFLGDPGILYRGGMGLITWLNGAIYLETRDKEDRKIATHSALQLLKNKGSLLIFPEGAWNIEPAMPVMKLFPGTVRIARESGCKIVPIAIELYCNTYYVNIGKEFEVIGLDKDDWELTTKLRDILATLKWEIFEKQGLFLRKEVSSISSKQYAEIIINRVDYGYTLEDVYETRFQDNYHN